MLQRSEGVMKNGDDEVQHVFAVQQIRFRPEPHKRVKLAATPWQQASKASPKPLVAHHVPDQFRVTGYANSRYGWVHTRWGAGLQPFWGSG
jgi:hypothetical protein